jgi:hypothetical protein
MCGPTDGYGQRMFTGQDFEVKLGAGPLYTINGNNIDV